MKGSLPEGQGQFAEYKPICKELCHVHFKDSNIF